MAKRKADEVTEAETETEAVSAVVAAKERQGKNAPSNAEVARGQMTQRERWATEYDADPKTVTATNPLNKRRPEVTVLNAIGYGIDLGPTVYGPFTASAAILTEASPTAHAIVEGAKTAVATAKVFDAGHRRDAIIEQYKSHPAEYDLPDATLPGAEDDLAAAKVIVAAVDDALNELTRMGLDALKAPKVAKVLAEAWREEAHPVIDPAKMLGAEMIAAEDRATGARKSIEAVYGLHLGSMNTQERKKLRALFQEAPREMPTIEDVYVVTRAAEIEQAAKREAFEIEKAEKREKLKAESSVMARARNPQREA
jgi:uncharacterized protein YgbK (DUF1537 family)